MTVEQISYKFLPLLLLFCMNYPPITCQNCGLPRVIRVSNHLAESVDTGQQILPPISVQNVVGASLSENPGNFAAVTFIPNTKSSTAQICLKVETPLWKPSDTLSFIDRTKLNEVNISVVLQCADGRDKEVQISIPITDENTAMPKFTSKNYTLETEPCVHERCVLPFATDIIVIDQDRDERNAKVNLWTSDSHLNFLHPYSIVEKLYTEDDDGVLRHEGFQTRVKLEYTPSYGTKSLKSINFTIYANNTKAPADGIVFLSSSVVTINFEENPHRLIPPVFTSPLYYAHVAYEGEQVYTKPRNIFAYVPGQESSETNIHYLLEGEPDIFHIDRRGDLSFIKDIGILRGRSSGSTRVDYNVTALRNKTTDEGITQVNTTVPLIVFFDEECTLPPTPEPPECQCDSTSTPEPNTCPPPVTCPDPCPGTTIGPPIIEPSTHRPTRPSTTFEPSTTTLSPTTDPPTSTETTLPSTAPPMSSTTAESTVTPDPETTIAPPTDPPGDCTCNCKRFTCKNPQGKPSLNTTHYSVYPDPFHCTKYHHCAYPDNDDDNDDGTLTFSCSTGTVFCPTISACTTVEVCIDWTNLLGPSISERGHGNVGEEEEECPHCDCQVGIPPTDPENVCNLENYDLLIPDHQFCDVFHQCTSTDNTNSSFIDHHMLCPSGLIFCPATNQCEFHFTPGCGCESNRMFQQCDVCVMGKWSGFDIFTKRFI